MANKLLVKVEDVEIRGLEEKEGGVKDKETGEKYPPYLVVKFDDAAGNRHDALERDLENKDIYKRGVFGDIVLEVSYNNYKGNSWCRFYMKSFTPKKNQ